MLNVPATKRRWILQSSSLVFGSAALVFAGALIGTVDVSATTSVGGRLLGAVIALLLLLFAWRVLRISLVLESDGLRIRNLRHSYRIPWADVESVDQGDYPFSTIVIQTRNGIKVPVSGLLTYLSGPTYRYWTKRRNSEVFHAVTRELNAHHAEHH